MKNKKGLYSDLLNQTLNKKEKEGLEELFNMMIALRQQILLRIKFKK